MSITRATLYDKSRFPLLVAPHVDRSSWILGQLNHGLVMDGVQDDTDNFYRALESSTQLEFSNGIINIAKIAPRLLIRGSLNGGRFKSLVMNFTNTKIRFGDWDGGPGFPLNITDFENVNINGLKIDGDDSGDGGAKPDSFITFHKCYNVHLSNWNMRNIRKIGINFNGLWHNTSGKGDSDLVTADVISPFQDESNFTLDNFYVENQGVTNKDPKKVVLGEAIKVTFVTNVSINNFAYINKSMTGDGQIQKCFHCRNVKIDNMLIKDASPSKAYPATSQVNNEHLNMSNIIIEGKCRIPLENNANRRSTYKNIQIRMNDGADAIQYGLVSSTNAGKPLTGGPAPPGHIPGTPRVFSDQVLYIPNEEIVIDNFQSFVNNPDLNKTFMSILSCWRFIGDNIQGSGKLNFSFDKRLTDDQKYCRDIYLSHTTVDSLQVYYTDNQTRVERSTLGKLVLAGGTIANGKGRITVLKDVKYNEIEYLDSAVRPLMESNIPEPFHFQGTIAPADKESLAIPRVVAGGRDQFVNNLEVPLAGKLILVVYDSSDYWQQFSVIQFDIFHRFVKKTVLQDPVVRTNSPENQAIDEANLRNDISLSATRDGFHFWLILTNHNKQSIDYRAKFYNYT